MLLLFHDAARWVKLKTQFQRAKLFYEIALHIRAQRTKAISSKNSDLIDFLFQLNVSTSRSFYDPALSRSRCLSRSVNSVCQPMRSSSDSMCSEPRVTKGSTTMGRIGIVVRSAHASTLRAAD